MKGITIILSLILIGLIACSSGDKKNKDEESLSAEVEKSIGGGETEEVFAEIELEETSELNDKIEEEEVVISRAPKREILSQVTIKESGDYVVKKGDTLLYISFKIYGDYRKWRVLLNSNPGLSPENLLAGTKLKYELPEAEFNWNPQGIGHLITKGETLGKISTLYYGTSKKWKDIYMNNRKMILDPDLIFAGFTLFYIPNQVANAGL